MRIRIGIAGAGAVVRERHLPALQRLPELFEVTATCGRTPARAQALAAQTGAAYCESVEELAGNSAVDAILVAVPIDRTYRVAMQALEGGKHILVEKPLGASLAEADALVRRAEASPGVAAIAQQSCYWRWILELSRLLQSGAIGRLRSIDVTSLRTLEAGSIADWRAEPRYPAGFFWDGGVHWTSIVRMLAGELQSGTATLGAISKPLGGPESVTCHFQTNAEVLGQLSYVRRIGNPPHAEASINLVGFEGSISANEREIVLNRPGAPIERLPVAPDAPFVAQLERFHASIHGAANANPLSEGEADLRTVAQILRWAGYRDERVREVEGKLPLADTSAGRGMAAFAENPLDGWRAPVTPRAQPARNLPADALPLSQEQRETYERDGFLGPLPLLEAEEVELLCQAGQGFRSTLESASGGDFLGPRLFRPLPWFKSAHIYVPAIRDLCLDERVLALVRSLLGPNLIAWGADYIERKAGQRQRWHVDVETLEYESLNVWVGLRRTDAATLNIVRGSRSLAPPQELMTDGTKLDDDEAVLELAQRQDARTGIEKLSVPPGCCALFSGRLWHGASQQEDRSALLLQYSPEGARVRVPVRYDPPYVWHELPPPCYILREG